MSLKKLNEQSSYDKNSLLNEKDLITEQIVTAQKELNKLHIEKQKIERVLYKVYEIGANPNGNDIVDQQNYLDPGTFIDDFALINNVYSFGAFSIYTLSSAALMGYSIFTGNPITIGVSSGLFGIPLLSAGLKKIIDFFRRR